MSMSNELFTPDNVDDQIDQLVETSPMLQRKDQSTPAMQLVRHLRYFYEVENAESDMASLGRVKERLEHVISTISTDNAAEEQHEPIPAAAENDLLRSSPAKSARRHKLQRSMAMIAAVLMLTLLVGSMVTVFNMARTSRSVSVGGSSDDIVYVFDGTLSKLDLAHKTIVWSKQLNNLSSFTVAQSQPVSNGIVYVAAVANQPYVYAFKTADGALLWRTPLLSPDTHPSLREVGFVLQPVVANGLIYTMTGNGQVFVLNAATGKQLRDYVLNVSGVTAENIAVNAQGTIYATHSNEIIAIDDSNGSKLQVKSWTKYINPGQIISSIALDGDTLYVTSDTASSNPGSRFTASLYALDTATGQTRWSVSESSPDFSEPVVANGKVYVGAQNKDATTSIYAFSSSSGSLVWHKKTPEPYILKPVVNDGVVYVQVNTSSTTVSGGPFIPNVRMVYALDATTGAVRWQHQQTRQDVLDFSFLERDGVLYMIGRTIAQPFGRLIIEALNASTGRQM